jgi:hypothetical protein
LDDTRASAPTLEEADPLSTIKRSKGRLTETAGFISKAFGSQTLKASTEQPRHANATSIPSSALKRPQPAENEEQDAELGITLDEPMDRAVPRRRPGSDTLWSEGRSSPKMPTVDSQDSDNLMDTDLDSEDLTDSLGYGGDEREPVLAFKSTAQGENEDGTVLNAENAVVGGALNSTNRSSFEGKQKLSL